MKRIFMIVLYVVRGDRKGLVKSRSTYRVRKTRAYSSCVLRDTPARETREGVVREIHSGKDNRTGGQGPQPV